MCAHQEIKRRLEIAEWSQAWDGYAIALTVLKIMTYSQAVEHKLTVLEVAALGTSEGRGPLLGVLYDEVVRWAFVLVCV